VNTQPVRVFPHNKLDVTWHSYVPRGEAKTRLTFRNHYEPFSEPRLPISTALLAVKGIATKGERDLAAPARYRPDAVPIWSANPQCGSY